MMPMKSHNMIISYINGFVNCKICAVYFNTFCNRDIITILYSNGKIAQAPCVQQRQWHSDDTKQFKWGGPNQQTV